MLSDNIGDGKSWPYHCVMKEYTNPYYHGLCCIRHQLLLIDGTADRAFIRSKQDLVISRGLCFLNSAPDGRVAEAWDKTKKKPSPGNP